MPIITIVTEQSNPWSDLRTKEYINAMGNGIRISICPLKGGMKSGSTSCTFRVDLPDGKIILFETSLAALSTAVDIIKTMEKAGTL